MWQTELKGDFQKRFARSANDHLKEILTPGEEFPQAFFKVKKLS